MNMLKFKNNVCVSVQGGEIVVSAPWYMRKKYIQQIINEKSQWILSKLKEKANESFVPNDYVRLLGKEYSIILVYKNTKNPVINLEDDIIKVILPNKFKKFKDTYVIDTLINKLYTKVSNDEIERAMEKTRLLLGIAPENFKISELDKKSLAKFVQESQSIIFSNNICAYNREIIDYIVLHEYCHIKYKVHCKSFWKLISTYCPNYKKYEEILKEKKY